ncbi:MAG: hypothetical protein IKF82_01165 [Bacilli bacterium]|nr:hypothetical protein [Bacilli bacterium]
MIRMMPQFVSADDFINYWGLNLSLRLKNDDNLSNKTNIFLSQIEDRLMAWVDANTFRTIPWEYYKDEYEYKTEEERKVAQVRKEAFKKAILNQAMYVYRNSNIGLDSGYDPEKGVIVQSQELQAIEICRPAIDYLKTAGLYNHVMRNTFRYTTFNR